MKIESKASIRKIYHLVIFPKFSCHKTTVLEFVNEPLTLVVQCDTSHTSEHIHGQNVTLASGLLGLTWSVG